MVLAINGLVKTSFLSVANISKDGGPATRSCAVKERCGTGWRKNTGAKLPETSAECPHALYRNSAVHHGGILLYPEALNEIIAAGLLTFPGSGSLPVPNGSVQWHCCQNLFTSPLSEAQDYSSGYCPGFSPGSLLSRSRFRFRHHRFKFDYKKEN